MSGRRRVRVAAGGALLAAVALIAAVGSGAFSRDAQRAAPIASVSLSGTMLRARDADGRSLWSHDFRSNVLSRADPAGPGHGPDSFAAAEDIDKDSVPDLVISVMFGEYAQGPPDHDELFAFSGRDGRVLWSRRLSDSVTFGAGRFRPPWMGIQPGGVGGAFTAKTVATFRVGGRLRIAWAQTHHTWWPSILSILDDSGVSLWRWVHSGMIYSLATTTHEDPQYLLAGGVSNSREAAFLAVLDPRGPEGAGPEEPGAPFACVSCGPGRPLRYFLFEPSELLLAVNPYNWTQEIRVRPGSVEVLTVESPGSPPASFDVLGIALFSEDLELNQVAWSSSWDNRHRELERQGKIDHPLESCKHRGEPPRVREWSPATGWHDVKLATSAAGSTK